MGVSFAAGLGAKVPPLQPAAYLQRIGHRGPLEPTLDTLRRLHLAHLTSVPFENLDIHLGRPIALDRAAWFRKIVAGRRGGFCYELNGLFAWLLRELSFEVTLLSARVASQPGVFGAEFDHLALQVDLSGGRWLADVGFGRSFLEPLSLDAPSESEAEGRHYRVVPGNPDWTVEHRLGGAPPQPDYRFTLTARQVDDFAGMCRYHQTSPDSPFPKKRVCTRATAGGRITFLDGAFLEDRDGAHSERALTEEEVGPLLRERFGLPLTDDEVRGWSRPKGLPAPG